MAAASLKARPLVYEIYPGTIDGPHSFEQDPPEDAPRACDGAPVSMPLAWSRIEQYAISRTRRAPIETFKQYTIASVPELLRRDGDVWASMRRVSLRGMANPGGR